MGIHLRRYFLEIAYKGTDYHGWQIQENAVTVQSVLQEKLQVLLKEEVSITGAGRTDTGVHARQIFAHFDTSRLTETEKLDRLVYSLNAILPQDIAIKRIIEVHSDAHARFDAVERSYEYHLHFSKNPFLNGLSCYQKEIPEVERMNEAAALLLGKRDYSCFSKSHTQVYTNICDILSAQWVWREDKLVFCIKANRFLRNMVRAIVGTLLEIGFEAKPATHILDVIKSKDRSQAGTSVPAHGLYLCEVKYPYV